MEFISVEEFLKQPKEVQHVFMEWWKPQPFDLYIFDKRSLGLVKKSDKDYILPYKSNNIWEEKKHCIPLLTEGQLRKFIEDKTNGKVMVEYTVCENIVLKLATKSKVTGGLEFKRNYSFPKSKFNLLQAYWEVALKEAEESAENGL